MRKLKIGQLLAVLFVFSLSNVQSHWHYNSHDHSCCNCKQTFMVMSGMIAMYKAEDPTFMCAIGFKDGRVGDDDITASSSLDAKHGPEFARFANQRSASYPSYMGGWSSKYAKAGEWIQANLRQPMKVTGIVTQGRARNDVEQWVTTYDMTYSYFGNYFHDIDDLSGNPLLFHGNADRQSPSVNFFPKAITAQYFRLTVHGFHNWPSLRMELLAC